MARGAVVLDSGALTAFGEREEGIREFIRRATAEKATVVVPSVVVAESTTGTARDAGINQVLAALTVASLSEQIARSAAALRFHAQRPLRDTIDAVVVATADMNAGTVILSADVKDLEPLAAVRTRSKVLKV